MGLSHVSHELPRYRRDFGDIRAGGYVSALRGDVMRSMKADIQTDRNRQGQINCIKVDSEGGKIRTLTRFVE